MLVIDGARIAGVGNGVIDIESCTLFDEPLTLSIGKLRIVKKKMTSKDYLT